MYARSKQTSLFVMCQLNACHNNCYLKIILLLFLLSALYFYVGIIVGVCVCVCVWVCYLGACWKKTFVAVMSASMRKLWRVCRLPIVQLSSLVFGELSETWIYVSGAMNLHWKSVRHRAPIVRLSMRHFGSQCDYGAGRVLILILKPSEGYDRFNVC